MHRVGLYYCASCNGQFTVTIGTVMEDRKSHFPNGCLRCTSWAPLRKELARCNSRACSTSLTNRHGFLPSHSRSDDARHTRPYRRTEPRCRSRRTLIGGKKKNRAFAKKEPKKHTILTLVDRDGDSHSFHIANVKAKTLRETIVKVASRKSYLATDELTNWRATRRSARNSQAMAPSIIRPTKMSALAGLFTSTQPNAGSVL